MRTAVGLVILVATIMVGAATMTAIRRPRVVEVPSPIPEIIPPMPRESSTPDAGDDPAGNGFLSRLIRFNARRDARRAVEELDRALREYREPPDYSTRPDRCGLDKILSGSDLLKVCDILEDEDRRLQFALEYYTVTHSQPGSDPLPGNSWESLRTVIATEPIEAGLMALLDLPSAQATAVRHGEMSIGEAIGYDAPLAALAEALHRVRKVTYANVEEAVSADDAKRFRKWLPEGQFTGRRCVLDLGKAPTPLRR